MYHLLAFFLFAAHLFAYSPQTSVTENDPSSLVEGVSVITGDLYVYEEDYVVQGAEPISLRRSYLSSDGSSRVYEHLIATFYCTMNKLYLREPNGTELIYYPDAENGIHPAIGNSFYPKKKKPLIYRARNFINNAPGVSNTSSGKMSAKTNLKNQYILFDPKIDEKGKDFTLYAADGTKRRYQRSENQEKVKGLYRKEYLIYQYRLVYEELPNGHVVRYQWDSKNRLREIFTSPKNTDKKRFATVSIPAFDKNQPPSQLTVSGSDNRSLIYHYTTPSKKTCHNHLISSPENPDQSFHWASLNNTYIPVIEQFSLPKGRLLQVSYEDTYEHRVKTLSSPVGKDGTSIVTHTFAYNPKAKNSSVVDVKGNKTAYYWNDQFRLTRIDRYAGPSTLHSSDLFVWEGTQLKCKTFLDAKGNPVFSKTYQYDDFGNVKEERFYGNLSGLGSPLQLGADGLPIENGVEKSIRKTSYTQDGRNLPLRQEEQSGLVVEYEYDPVAHLATAKFLCDGNQVKVRTFSEYDAEYILKREIVDNGSSRDPKNPAGVTTRTIKERSLKQTGPYLGLPEKIEEKYWDGKDEVLLTSQVLHYTTGALIEKKEVFDSTSKLRYALNFKYDEKGRLKEETNPIGQCAIYKYDAVGNREYIKDFSGRVETTIKYDFSNRPFEKEEVGFDGIKRKFLYSYDLKHNLESETDPYDNQTLYDYDSFGHRIETTFPPTPNKEGELVSSVIQQRYDSAGNEILRIDARKYETKTEYNAYGKPILITHPDGVTENFTYYLDGSLKTHTDAKDVKTEYTYDFLGRVTTKTVYSSKNEERASESFEYDGLHLISKTDREGYQTIFKYDSAGRKKSEECCGEKIIYSYDSLGRVEKVEEGQLITVTTYDDLDRPITENKESLSGTILRTVSYEYDAAGNRKAIIRNINGKTEKETFEYDSFNRLIKKTDPLGHFETFSYNDGFLNDKGQKVLQKTHTDSLGLQTIETYDARGRIASLEKKKEKTLSLQEKIYNLSGALIYQTDKVYSPDGTSRFINTSWETDNRDRLKTLIEAEGTEKPKTTTYTYHVRGELFQTTKPDGTVLTYDYNDLGYLISLTSSDGTINHKMDYDLLGRLTEFDGILRTVDHRGRLLTEVSQGHDIENRYDERGRRRFFLCPKADCTIEYRYDALDLKNVLWKEYSHTYTSYDQAGNLIEEELIGSLGSIQYTPDPLSRTKSLTAPSFSQEILEFDLVGNIRQMLSQEDSITYTYDDLYQLTSESGPFAHTYSYDSLYNRLQKDSQKFEINALNQTSQFEYDANGNPILHADMTLTYDALNRLIRLETPILLQTFTYDYLNRCLSKTTNDETIYFLYDGQNEIGAFDKNLNITELRILGSAPHAEISAAIAILLQDLIYAPIHDIQGNLSALLPLSGEPTFFRYSAFGEEKLTGPSTSPWRFSSKRTDSLTTLVNFGRRYYLPSIGRWLTPDPIGFADGMNLYAFVHNDPLIHFDEYGLSVAGANAFYETTTQEIRNYLGGRYKFDNHYHVYNPKIAQSSLLSRPNFKPRGEVVFFNGIRTQQKGKGEFFDMLYYISKLGGNIPVHGIHMPTHGAINDLQICNYTLEIGMNSTALHGERYFREASKRVGPDGRILALCHSAGAINEYFAGMRLPEEIRAKITVRAFAPGKIIPRRVFGGEGNFMSSNPDFVMKNHKRVDREGYKQAKRSGLLQVLPAHPDASKINDHNFMSPTFSPQIKLELMNFSDNFDCR